MILFSKPVPLAQARRMKLISQHTAGKHIGRSQGYFSQIERGEVTLDEETKKHIA